jgi:steroid 5-alpha reductase family enzyme
MSNLLMIQTIAILIYSSLWFLAAQRLRRYDIADVAWGLGFFFLALIAQISAADYSFRDLLLLVLVALWGLRLSLYIYLRNQGKEEDPRYRKWRTSWGAHATVRAYFQLFLFQGLLIVVILAPVTYVLAHPDPGLKWLDVPGIAIWLGGFITETVSDYQLSRFKRNPDNKGRFITAGLWKYSRHPNYFGEVTLWWGIWLIACSVSGGWITIAGPATITILILFVSGIPLLEKRYEGSLQYQAYRRRTSAFIPLPPKR